MAYQTVPAANTALLIDTVAIEQGAAIARIAPEVYESNPTLHKQLHHFLDARFKVQQYKTAKTYNVDSGSLTEYHLNGRRTMHVSCFVSCESSISLDFMISDSGGKTTFDSSVERQKDKLKQEQKKLDLLQLDEQVAQAIGQHYRKGPHPENSLLDSLLASHLSARNDPGQRAGLSV